MGRKVGGFDELCSEFRAKRDGLDCVWNVIISISVSDSSTPSFPSPPPFADAFPIPSPAR